MNPSSWMVRSVLLIFLATEATTPAAESPRPVSVTSLAGLSGGGDSFAPAFSADGRIVVFLSCANNLVKNDSSAAHLDVFRHELSSGQTVLVSVDVSGYGGGNGDSAFASISSNGQFVAFSSAASNLVGNDTNGLNDVFVRDMESGTTTRASVGVGSPSYSIRAPWPYPRISENGHWVVFQTKLPDWSGEPDFEPYRGNTVFARENLEERTVIVSVSITSAAPANAGSALGSVTPDARFVAFVSRATDLVTNGPVTSRGDVFVRDLQAEVTLWASQNMETNFNGLSGFQCLSPVLSADGRYVAYLATETGFGQVCVLHHDLQTGTRTLLTTKGLAATALAISADGRFVAHEEGTNVFVWDALTGSNQLVSVNGAGTAPGNGPSRSPVLSADAHAVAFLSAATDLVTNTVNGFFQLYVRDLVAGTTRLVSVNRDDTGSSDLSAIVPALSADGRLAAFDSLDGNLVQGDGNQASDVFVRDLDAETTRLVSLADVTLPCQVIPLNGGPKILLWSAVPGREYRVQFKDSLTEPNWSELPFLVTANTTTCHFVDNTSPGATQRFCRVTLVP